MPQKATAAPQHGERRFKEDGFTVAWAIDRETGRVVLRLLLGERKPLTLVLDGSTGPRPFELVEPVDSRPRRASGELRLEDREGGRRALVSRLRFGGGRVYVGPLAEWEPAPPTTKHTPPEGTPSSHEDWF